MLKKLTKLYEKIPECEIIKNVEKYVGNEEFDIELIDIHTY